MTDRRPPGASIEGWVEQRVREAEERGDFADNPLLGKPLPSIEEPLGDYGLIARIAEREGVDVAPVLLPPSILVMKELEALPALLARQSSEQAVTEIVQGLNQRIRDVHLRPSVGPPLRARPLDLETTLEQWRAARPVPEPHPLPVISAGNKRRRWRRR